MPDFHNPRPFDWPYDQATERNLRKVEAFVKMARENEDLREQHMHSAWHVYRNWRRFSDESGQLDPEDDARMLGVLNLPVV